MIAALGFLLMLVGAVLILTTYTGTTGQVLGSILGSGGGASPSTPAATATGATA